MLRKIIYTAAVLAGALSVLPALAKNAADKPTPRDASNLVASAACVGAAVTKRETAVGAAFTAFSAAQTNALSARQTALQTAYGKTTTKEIKTAVNEAWKAYRVTHRATVKTHNENVKGVWKQFKTETRACKPSGGVGGETRGVGDDMVQ